MPNYLKGNETLEEIVERGCVTSKAKRDAFSKIAPVMTKVAAEETRTKIKESCFEATGYLVEELLIQYEEHATDDVVYESRKSLNDFASYAA